MWSLIQISVRLVALVTRIHIQFGKSIPSLADLVFISLFAIPVVVGAYYYMTHLSRRKRLISMIGMILPPALIFVIQLVDRLAQSLSAGAWLMDGWLLLAILIGLTAYVISSILLARFIAYRQSLNG